MTIFVSKRVVTTIDTRRASKDDRIVVAFKDETVLYLMVEDDELRVDRKMAPSKIWETAAIHHASGHIGKLDLTQIREYGRVVLGVKGIPQIDERLTIVYTFPLQPDRHVEAFYGNSTIQNIYAMNTSETPRRTEA